MSMDAHVIAIGTELLLGEIVNTNAAYIAGALREAGISLKSASMVGDDYQDMVREIKQTLARVDVLITSGGLGPTNDDITKEAVAGALGLSLVENDVALDNVRSFFQRIGRQMTENNIRQARLPEGSIPIPNPVGTAAGVLLETAGKIIICLPGVPVELKAMWKETVDPYLQRQAGIEPIRTHDLLCVGIGESSLEEKIADIIKRYGRNPYIRLYASQGEVRIRVACQKQSAAKADALVEEAVKTIKDRLGEKVYGDGQTSLEEVVGRLLIQRGSTLALAESCTGGLIAKRLTDIPGSSRYFRMGVVTYSNESKQKILGVPAEVLDQYGAVSPETARYMVEGIHKLTGSDVAISVTGIAGPSGGSEQKPVGLVYVGLIVGQGQPQIEELRLTGTRETIRYRTSQHALDMVRRALIS